MKRNRETPLQRLRREVRKSLRLQLDTVLKGPTELPDGTQGTVLDDICARSLVGYGFGISIHVRHPNEAGRAEEDPGVKPRIIQ